MSKTRFLRGKPHLNVPPPVWYHRQYLINLPDQPQPVILDAFRAMIESGTITDAGVIESPEHLKQLYRQVELANNDRARAVRFPNTGKLWVRERVVVWRGCWCIKQVLAG